MLPQAQINVLTIYVNTAIFYQNESTRLGAFRFGLKGIESCPYSPVGCTSTSANTGRHLYSLFVKRKENAVIPFESTTSSRTAVRSRRLFYALQQKSSLTHFVAPPSKNKTARPLQASSTTSALRCAGFCFCLRLVLRMAASILSIFTKKDSTHRVLSLFGARRMIELCPHTPLCVCTRQCAHCRIP